ncbi:hypothetical protein [Anaerococcus sp. AGMB09787]|uniref:hypothetical protein n=1 Tax=Anaerococcus sp. AGMB09787 TaxID=2922869 RepID=UPI001FAEE27C|nr:hypothetical protein [Anaerococcus sp. AGMB09787]
MTLLYQGLGKPKTVLDYIVIIGLWLVVIFLIVGFNIVVGELNINKYLVLFLRIWATITIPFSYPAYIIAHNKKSSSSWLLFWSYDILGLLVAPFYVYKNLDEVTF